jgi:guanylate kinase
MKKSKLFLLGLTTGASVAAYITYRHIDDDKLKPVLDKTFKTAGDLKDRALDYAFYALDSIDDLKDSLQYKTSDAKEKFKDVADKVNDNVSNKAQYYYDEGNTQFHQAADNLRNKVKDTSDNSDNDVILNSEFLEQKSNK